MLCNKCREEMTLMPPESRGMPPDTWYCHKDGLYAREVPGMFATDSGYIVFYSADEQSDATSD